MLLCKQIVRSFAKKPYVPVTRQTRRIEPILARDRIEPRTMKLDNEDFKSMFTPQLNKLAEMFKKNNFELRIAGGAVRDLIMGIRPADVDFASTATPEEMKDLFEREQIRMLHKRGEEHGTITCRIDGAENFEITTLRVDVVCDGRRAEVQYTTDWQLDANRRDLTINSMFLDLDGTVIDFFGGIEDVHRRRVAFVGNAEQRIQEDYLRILRYFRFFGRIAAVGEHEKETIAAIKRNAHGLAGISAERIWTELKRIVVGRMAPQVVRCMLEECKLNEYLGMPENANVDRFEKVYNKYHGHLESMTMVACLCTKIEEINQFHNKTKLSNSERIVGEFVVEQRVGAEKASQERDIEYFKSLIVDLDVQPGHETTKITGRERVLQLAMSVCAEEAIVNELKQWKLPVFPVKGLDLMKVGASAGPKMRNTLQYLYDLWKKSRYTLSQEDLLKHCNDPEIPEGPPQRSKAAKRKRQDSNKAE